jgi:hypothetical protein
VLPLHRADDVGERQLVPLEPVGVEPQPDLAVAEADEARRADVLQALEALLHRLLREAGELAEGEVAGDDDGDDRRGVDVELLDDRLLDLLGEAIADAGDLGADLLEGDVDVLVQLELDDDLGDALRAGRAQVLDPGDGVDGLLDGVGDRRLDGLRSTRGKRSIPRRR